MSMKKILILVSVLILSIQLATASEVSVFIISGSTTSDGIVTLPISINGAATVSSATIMLSYNPAVVVVNSVSSGNLGTFSASINNAIGITTLSAFSVTGASGNITLANVEFQATGSAGSTSSLNLGVSDLKDINTIDIPFTANNGTFAIITGVTPLGVEAGGPYSGIAGTGVQFSGSVNGGSPPYTYSWDFADGSTSNLQNPTHSYSFAGSYAAMLTVTDASSSFSTDSAPVNIISPGGAVVGVSTVQSFSSSISTARINVSNVQNLGAVNVKLFYNPSVVTVQGVSQGTMGFPIASINNAAGIVIISITSVTGVSGNIALANINLMAVGPVNASSPLGVIVTELADVMGNPIPSTANNGSFLIIPGFAPLTADAQGPYSGNAGSSISFMGVATGGIPPYTTYSWDFGDGSTSNLQNPNHTYSSGGTYNVQLQVRDNEGVTASSSAIANIVGEGAMISIGSANLTVNNTGIVSIKVENVLDLAAVTLTLSYNPSMISVDKVGPGFFGSPTSKINNAAGTASMSIFSLNTGSGNLTLTNLTLRGISTGSSPLNLVVTTFTDANGVPISKSIKSGTSNVLSVIKGDVNGDRIVNIIDALFIAQYTVGTRTLTVQQQVAADVNSDGTVNIIDALFIAQNTVGLRTCFC